MSDPWQAYIKLMLEILDAPDRTSCCYPGGNWAKLEKPAQDVQVSPPPYARAEAAS